MFNQHNDFKSAKHYISPIYSYAFGTNRLFYSTYDDVTRISQDTVFTEFTYLSYNFSLGGGKTYGVLYGLCINDFFRFEASLAYFKGNERDIKSFSHLELNPFSVYNVTFKYSSIFNYDAFNLSPSLLLSANRKKWNPYISMGLHLSYGKLTEKFNVNIHNNLPGYIPTERYQYTYIYSPKLLIGWHETIGIELSNSKFFDFFVEAQHINLSSIPKQKDCVSFLYQGEDNMDNISISESNVYFVEMFRRNEFNADSPGKQLQMKFSMSSIAFKCGIRYYFR